MGPSGTASAGDRRGVSALFSGSPRVSSASRLAGLALVGTLLTVSSGAARPSTEAVSDWRLVVLGIAQDGGIPQLGCDEGVCHEIRLGHRKRERVASIGLVNATLKQAYLIDATPDFVSQVDSLTGGPLPNGIFLTHGHIGHYTGLMYLG